METENNRAFLRKASEPRSLGGDRHPPLLAERIEQVAIDHIKPYEANAREHDDRQITKLAGR